MPIRRKRDLYSVFRDELGIYPPRQYVRVLKALERKGGELAGWSDQWTPGLWPVNLAIGTTRAFRERFKDFDDMTIVAGYAGTRMVEKVQELQDVYYLLDVVSMEVREFDSQGLHGKSHGSFDEWLDEMGIEVDEEGG